MLGPLVRARRLDALESRLVWILGSPRSGSTWLLQLLVHPLVDDDAAPMGVARREAPEAGAPLAVPVNEPYIPHHLAPDLPAEQVFNPGLPAVTLPALRRGSPSYFLSDRFREVWRPRLRELVLARLAAQADAVSREFGARRPLVVIKEPNGSLGADFVMSLLPRSRLLFLLRDGRDVVDSMLDARLPGGWLAGRDAGGSPAQRLALVEDEARLWLARTLAVQRAYDAHPPALRLLVRYEDARADPAAVLEQLDAWLGLGRGPSARADAIRWNDFDSFPAAARGRGMPLRTARPGAWSDNLSGDERRVIEEIIGPKLRELGYSA